MKKRITFTVTTTASQWWVAIENGDFDLKKPTKSKSFDLPAGLKHAALYYARGPAGTAFKLVGKDDAGTVVVNVDKKVAAVGGLLYGHKGFTP